MAEFINTSRGLLNLDHVLWIRHAVGKEAGGESWLQLADGRVVQCHLYSAVPMAPVILAAAKPTYADEEPKPTYADEGEAGGDRAPAA